ncbi:MAG: hypothetical protein WBA57_11140 [Elainellaceae cyanobacterium]
MEAYRQRQGDRFFCWDRKAGGAIVHSQAKGDRPSHMGMLLF